MYNQGISRTGELIDVGAENDIVKKSGAWYSYGEHRIGQGRENAKSFLADNPDIAEEIELQVRETLGIASTNGASAPQDTGAETEDEDK